ncbi:MAG: hypothetical protein O9346_12945 [Leptospiraceae bacterium]|nr:hypothetical protein [Leptospiraceae bacterium]MCZ8347317.1 hypothetical protein [Leptospiraceae bacterium]PJE03745.1 MAG: hypothetical protein CK427_04530 [Leptospira sp.]
MLIDPSIKPQIDFTKVRTKVLLTLMPKRSITWVFSSFMLLFLSLFTITLVYVLGSIDRSLFLVLIATSTLLLCMYSLIAGIFLFAHTNPFYQEWKDRLGYED